jgi:hypothetical protein
MATVAERPEYAIESQADTLLNRLSGKVASLVLSQAAQNTPHRTTNGVPLVTAEDIRNTAQSLARFLEEARKKEDHPSEVRDILLNWESALKAALNAPPDAP